MGSGELPAGTRQRVHEGDRRQGHGRDDAVAGLPDQGLRRVQRQGRCLRHGRRRLASGSAPARPAATMSTSPTSSTSTSVDKTDGAGDRASTMPSIPAAAEVLGDSARRRRQRLGLPQGLVRGPEGDGGLQGQVRLRPRRAEDYKQLRDIAEFFYRPDQKRYGVAHLHRQLL